MGSWPPSHRIDGQRSWCVLYILYAPHLPSALGSTARRPKSTGCGLDTVRDRSPIRARHDAGTDTAGIRCRYRIDVRTRGQATAARAPWPTGWTSIPADKCPAGRLRPGSLSNSRRAACWRDITAPKSIRVPRQSSGEPGQSWPARDAMLPSSLLVFCGGGEQRQSSGFSIAVNLQKVGFMS